VCSHKEIPFFTEWSDRSRPHDSVRAGELWAALEDAANHRMVINPFSKVLVHPRTCLQNGLVILFQVSVKDRLVVRYSVTESADVVKAICNL
jgi:hypothetical protein